MYLPQEIVAALPSSLRPDDVRTHLRFDGVTGQTPWRTLHLLDHAGGLCWLAQASVIGQAQQLNVSQSSIISENWEHQLALTDGEGASHRFRVPSYEAEKLRALLSSQAAPVKAPEVAAAPALVPQKKEDFAASLPPPATAATDTRGWRPARSGKAHDDAARAVIEGRFDEARRLLHALAESSSDPDARVAVDQYSRLLDDLVNDQPDQMLYLCSDLSPNLSAIDPYGWIRQACIYDAYQRFRKRGDTIWSLIALQALSFAQNGLPAPCLPAMRPWLYVRDQIDGLNQDIKKDPSLHKEIIEEFQGNITVDGLTDIWFKRYENWVNDYLNNHPDDLTCLRNRLIDLLHTNMKDEQAAAAGEILTRFPGDFETCGMYLDTGLPFKRAQEIRRDIIKYNTARIEFSQYPYSLKLLADAAIWTEQWTEAARCCERLRAFNQPWIAGDADHPTLDVGRLLGQIASKQIVQAAESVLCAAGPGAFNGILSLPWVLAQALEAAGDLTLACALLYLISPSDKVFSDHAQRLADRLGTELPESIFERTQRVIVRRLEPVLLGEPSYLHAARCVLNFHLHDPDRSPASILKEADALLRAFPDDLEAIFLANAALATVSRKDARSSSQREQTVQSLVRAIDAQLAYNPTPNLQLLRIRSEHHPDPLERLRTVERLLGLEPDDSDLLTRRAHILLKLGHYKELHAHLDTLCTAVSVWDNRHVDDLLKAQRLLDGSSITPHDIEKIRKYIDNEDPDKPDSGKAQEGDKHNTLATSPSEGNPLQPTYGALPTLRGVAVAGAIVLLMLILLIVSIFLL